MAGLSACRSLPADMGPYGGYFPKTGLMRDGLVQKYYFTYTSSDGQQNWTDIRYYQYRLLPSGQLEMMLFGPALEKMSSFRLAFQDDGMRLVEQTIYWQDEALQVEIRDSAYAHWTGDSALLATRTAYPGGITEAAERVQQKVADTLVLSRPAKVFDYLGRRRFRYAGGEERIVQAHFREVYVSGLGLYATEIIREEGTARLELVEQLTAGNFAALASGIPDRVAYIDPADRLDKASTFQTCESPDRIADYYNGDPDAGLKGGKRALRMLFEEKLNRELLQGQSGYLTFRFVINCRDGAGWFITESADLDFKSKAFPAPLVRHVLNILEEVGPWQAALVDGRNRDAYAYVTLKLKDGKLVEILP